MEPLERLQRRADNVPGRVTHVAIMMNETRVIEMCDERTAEREAIGRDCAREGAGVPSTGVFDGMRRGIALSISVAKQTLRWGATDTIFAFFDHDWYVQVECALSAAPSPPGGTGTAWFVPSELPHLRPRARRLCPGMIAWESPLYMIST